MTCSTVRQARGDLCGIDSYPVTVSSEHVERKERGDPFSKPTKIPKPNENENHEQVRRDPYFSDIPEWLQEFRENLVDDRVPEHGDSHASSPHELSFEPTRSVELGKHSVYTHVPKDRNCEICQRTKITRAPWRRRIGRVVLRAENVGDLITADHKVLNEGCESRNNHRYAVVVQDLATQWIQSYPCKTKTSKETQRSLQKFLEPNRKPTVIYTDNSLEFGKACEDLSWNHCTSTPHRSETNGIAERAVRKVTEGTSAVLLQSGLDESWWADSMECYTYLRNIQDLLSDGKTQYERRFEEPFKGPIIPFGFLLEYQRISSKDLSKSCISSAQKSCRKDSDDRLAYLPEWSEEFKENLLDTELPASAHSSRESDLEHPTNVVSGKHSIYTHFPKDWICDVCVRTKNDKGSLQ